MSNLTPATPLVSNTALNPLVSNPLVSNNALNPLVSNPLVSNGSLRKGDRLQHHRHHVESRFEQQRRQRRVGGRERRERSVARRHLRVPAPDS